MTSSNQPIGLGQAGNDPRLPLRRPTVSNQLDWAYRPPIFSGPPEAVTNTTPVKIQAQRLEISGYHVDVTLDGFPFQFLRNDGVIPVFWVIEADKQRIFSVANVFLGSRLWFYTNGNIIT